MQQIFDLKRFSEHVYVSSNTLYTHNGSDQQLPSLGQLNVELLPHVLKDG